MWSLEETEYDWKSVHVKRISMMKSKLHSLYSFKQVHRVESKT